MAKFLFVDPPQGYYWGFPKAFELKDKEYVDISYQDLVDFVLKMGYPEPEYRSYPEGKFRIREWIQEIETENDAESFYNQAYDIA